MRFITVALAACGLLTACATPSIPYNWSGYSASLYALKKNPTDETLAAHKQVLTQVIQESEGKSMKVPPGIYAEYGYILVKEGKTEEGMKYLDLESQKFPEATVFVQRVKTQLSQPPSDSGKASASGSSTPQAGNAEKEKTP